MTVSIKPEILTKVKPCDDDHDDKSESIASENSDDDDVSDKGSQDDYDNMNKFKDCARPRDESPESKKLRKKAVKDAQADKRKVKIKKHVKKRKEKQGIVKKKL